MSSKLAELRANCEISKVNSMFEDYKISTHYAKFQEKALLILEKQKQEDEEAERLHMLELEKKKGLGTFRPKKKRKNSA